MNKDFNHIIRRSQDKETEEELLELHLGLGRAIDFGAEILDSDFKKGGTDFDLPPILFFRNLIGNLDAIAVLIKNSVIEPCNNLLRTVLENFFSIEYLLVDDRLAAQRIADFMVWDFVGRQKWLKRSDVNTDEYRHLLYKYKKDRIMRHSPVLTFPNAEAAWKHMDEVFELPGYKEAKNRYDQAKKLQRKNPMWYSLDGKARSLEDLAGQLGYPALYEMLYRSLSFTTHGNNVLQGNLSFDPNSVATILALRNSREAASIVNHCMNICYLSFSRYIEKRVPFMDTAFKEWLREIRPFNAKLSAKIVELSNREKLAGF